MHLKNTCAVVALFLAVSGSALATSFRANQTSNLKPIVINRPSQSGGSNGKLQTISLSAAPPTADVQNQTNSFAIQAAAVPTLSIEDQTITEGNSGTKSLAFKVSLSEVSATSVTVNYSTSNSSALAGSDYVAVPSTLLTIPAGQISKSVNITINGDTTSETDETFLVNLSSATGATIADGQGVGTIVNDDSTGFVVNTTADTNDGGCSAVGIGNGCSLREATNAANATTGPNTINFAPNVVGTITLVNGELVLNDNTTIIGPGANVLKVSGNNQSRVLNILTANNFQVSIYALAFTKGYSSGGSSSGGAIRVNSIYIQLALNDCAFDQNVSTEKGGAVFNEGTLAVNRCTFNNNSAAYGGAIGNQHFLTVDKSSFSANTSSGGGAIESGNIQGADDASAKFRDCTFSKNIVAALGGGAILAHNHSFLTVLDSSFTENQATNLLGGAILLGDNENDSFNSRIERSSFSANTSRYGSAIHNYHGTSIVNSCVFDDNSAAYVGTIYNHGNVSTSPDQRPWDFVTISNSTFRSNSAATSGGAVHNDYNHKATVINCNFIKNKASAGSAIMNAGDLTAENNTFTENQSDSGTIYVNDAPYPGKAQITNCRFNKNVASTYGGGIYNGTTAISNVDSSTFVSNQAQSGSAIFNMANLTMTNSQLSDNAATAGGAFYNNESPNAGTAKVTGCTFLRNTAATGAAMCNGTAANLTLIDSTFTSNKAVNGSAISNSGHITVNGSTFSENQASYAATFFNSAPNYTGTALLNNCTFYKNTAQYGAGAYSSSNCVLTVDSSTFADNSATILTNSVASDPSSTVYLKNSIFKTGSSGVNFSGSTIISNGHNLSSDSGQGYLTGPGDKINTNPQLRALNDNGGPTQTMLPRINSPAIDAGNTDLTVDQRGFARPQRNADDIGAVEARELDILPILTVSSPSAKEGSALEFVFNLSESSAQQIRVEVKNGSATSPAATKGNDFVGLSPDPTILIFAPGETNKKLKITTINDNRDEEDEKVAIAWSAPTVSPQSGIAEGIIVNDDKPAISIGDASVKEGDNGNVLLSFNVSLSNVSDRIIKGTYSTLEYTPRLEAATAGLDFVAIPATQLTFQPGETSKNIQVKAIGDLINELDEGFRVQLSDFANTVIKKGNAVGTIIDDDDGQPAISVGDATITEGDTGDVNLSFLVKLSKPGNQAITVKYETKDGSIFPAKAGSDYEAIALNTLTFPANTTNQIVNVKVKGDTIDEENETLELLLSAPTRATIVDGQAIGTIKDNDENQPQISINDVSEFEGNTGLKLFTFAVTLSAPSGRYVYVDFATEDVSTTSGSDYNGLSGTLSFAPGQTTINIPIEIRGDTLSEKDENFRIQLSRAVNALILQRTGRGTIKNDDKSSSPSTIGSSAGSS